MECTVCFSEFDEQDYRPLCLPCGHTVCSNCISDLSSASDPFSCPTCRKEVSASEAASLPTNYSLLERGMQSAEMRRGDSGNEVKCALHPHKSAKFHCGDCRQEFCSKCVTRHAGVGHHIEDFLQTLDRKLDSLLLEATSSAFPTSPSVSQAIIDQDSAVKSLKASLETMYEDAIARLIKEKEETVALVQSAIEWNESAVNSARNLSEKRRKALEEAREILRSARHGDSTMAEKKGIAKRAEDLMEIAKEKAEIRCELRVIRVKKAKLEGEFIEIEEVSYKGETEERKEEEKKAQSDLKKELQATKEIGKVSIHRDAPKRRKEPIWWFMSDSSTWSPYTLPLSRQIEAAYQRKEQVVELGKYAVDLTTMTQMNKATRRQRKVGREIS